MPSTPTTTSDIQQAMDEAIARVPAALCTLRRFYGTNNGAIAGTLGMSLSQVQERLTGKTKCSVGDLIGFARVFNVDPDILFGSDAEIIAWLGTHPERMAASPVVAWSTDYAEPVAA